MARRGHRLLSHPVKPEGEQRAGETCPLSRGATSSTTTASWTFITDARSLCEQVLILGARRATIEITNRTTGGTYYPRVSGWQPDQFETCW